MVREILISIYLLHVKFWFKLFNLFPQKNKTVFLSSFGDNIFYVQKKVVQHTDHETVILNVSNKDLVNNHEVSEIISFKLYTNIIGFIKGVYHLATAQVIFADNYHGVLAGTSIKPNVYCVQLWHANGAIKRFGLSDPSLKHRSEKAHKRLKSVYNRFTHVTAGSEVMGEIFKEAFQINDSKILKTGIPRTDLFFDEDQKNQIVEELKNEIPSIKHKKTIMYAPTYREHGLQDHEIKLDIQTLYNQLSDDYLLLLRLHPAILNQHKNEYPDFIVDVSSHYDVNHLLLVTDLLITDYSSIPFEFALLGRPMIFYPYDLEAYKKERGFWNDYKDMVPGPIATDTNQIVELVKQNHFDLLNIQAFSNVWNEYNDGEATNQLIQSIYFNTQ